MAEKKKDQQKKKLPDIVAATADYERWVSHHVRLIRSDVQLKHRSMAEATFPFLRATFYRWAQWWPIVCPELARGPRLLAVGDLHVDNFGTWRDLEGRLIWGINDFDEAWPAAYSVDLVRLVSSCYEAISEAHLSLTRKQASEAVEEGYRDSLARGGGPFVLAEHHRWLRIMAINELRDPVIFWKKIEACPKFKGKLPKNVRKILSSSFQFSNLKYELKSRVAGLGSLGHPRVVAVALPHGAHIAREAKQLTPSAWIWARKLRADSILSRNLLERAVRIPDPHVHFTPHWLVRRLAPDCSRIEISTLPLEHDESRLLYCMGWETANIHLGSEHAIPAIKRDLARRKNRWLHKAAKVMLKTTLNDWKHWRREWRKLPAAK
jgi:hypothetical protein